MSRRRYLDRHGNLVVVRGRAHTMPFGVRGHWPERQQVLGAQQAAESVANEARALHRQSERRTPCSGCGAAPGHAPGCIWRGHTG